jgi:oxygen-independent coproporphyrinogen-3 oxidase
VESHLPAHPLTPVRDGPAPVARAQARLGLYVHVPFCAQRCGYCDFSSGSLSAAAVERYLAAIEIEAGHQAPRAADARFTSVFFGGGTPSALSGRHFRRLWNALRSRFTIAADAEITLEANPESVRPALLEAWAEAGVNRLSMGAQSFDPDELRGLGRIHGPERPREAFALAREHGFRRLSLDLMFGFPGHTPATWDSTLAGALALEPEHLSAYCFIPEAETPLGRATLNGEASLPGPEQQAESYEVLVARVAAAGYGMYETSNFARPGGECRHNLVYWLRRPYLGLGPSAHSLWSGVRNANAYALEAWAAALEGGRPWAAEEPETAASRADEIVMLGLRLGTGLEPGDYSVADWRAVTDRYGAALRRAVEEQRLERVGAGFRIAARHRFVADDVIAWLMAAADRRAPERDLTLCEAHP